MPASSSTAPAKMYQPRFSWRSKAAIMRITPTAISQIPISSAIAATPPMGWRIRRTPTIAVSAPSSASDPRFWVAPMRRPPAR